MKNELGHYYKVCILLAAILLSSCSEKELDSGSIVSQFQNNPSAVSVSYAAVYDDQISEYITFSKGVFYRYYVSGKEKVYAERCFWGFSPNEQYQYFSADFSIADGQLYCAGAPYGAIEIKDDYLVLDGQKYLKIDAFKTEKWGTDIVIEGGRKKIISCEKQKISVAMSVVKPLPSGGKITFWEWYPSWIHTDLELKDGVLQMEVDENTTGSSREGMIVLRYPSLDTIQFKIKQLDKKKIINCVPQSQIVSSEGGNYSFEFSTQPINDPESVTARTQSLWITDVVVTDNVVSYNVVANSIIEHRTGSILLESGADCSYCFVVEQDAQDASSYSIDPSVANCYVISSAGTHHIKTVYGNTTARIEGIASAEVLWESFGTDVTPSKGDIIKSATYQAGTGSAPGFISFSTPTTLNNGNAVIAAKDASGNILWSWHIWVCKDYDPIATAQEYYNNAGTMMDRNLGATSATPGAVSALGLLYQWGRKDPFLGSSSISSNIKAASTISWPSPVSSNSSNGTIAYAVANPTTFITFYNSENFDWYYTGSSTTDNSRWQSSKTIFDPCPPGWRVPDGGSNGVWSKAINSRSIHDYPFDNTKKGMNFSCRFGSKSTIWYPATGRLEYHNGSLHSLGVSGAWWSCTPSGYYTARQLFIENTGYVETYDGGYRANGYSVRCVRE